ncbi:MAG: family 10 glycosylhydrolase [Bacteroidota bacterium]
MKFLLIVLCFSFLYCQPGERSYPVSAVDPKNTRDYPGGRGEHQMIIYTPAFGSSSTSTNQWGMEATVKQNIVISVGGNNSWIREGEFILSGHGNAKEFLLRNVKVGMKVHYTDSVVSVSFDQESFRVYAALRREALENKFTRMQSQFNDSDRVMLRITLDSTKVFSGSAASIVDSSEYDRELQILDELEYRMTVSPAVEGRGVWYTPVEKNSEEISAFVKRISDAGFNMLFLETVWQGQTIYPGFITKQKKEFAGFDPLRSFLDEGKKYGIEIRAVVHTFLAGVSGEGGDTAVAPVYSQHPEWQIVKRNGERISKAEPGRLYLNPAHPEVRDFIASVIKEIRTSYPDLSGIHLADVRYPVSVPLEESADYSETSRKLFREYTGVDPMDINPTDHPDKWWQWKLWREQIITNFLKRIRWENPEVLLSADIFPDIEESQKTMMQNWVEWTANGFVNILVPAIHSEQSESIGESIGKIRPLIGESIPLYIELMPTVQPTRLQLLQQIERCREEHSAGIILSSAVNLSDDQLRLLRIGPFRAAARTPTALTNNTKR